MQIVVNGSEKDVRAENISQLVQELAPELKYVAVACNGAIIPRTNWEEALLSDGDSIDIMSPVGGG